MRRVDGLSTANAREFRRSQLAEVVCLFLAGAAAVSACGDSPTESTEPTVAVVEVSPASETLTSIGATRQFSAVAEDADGNRISGKTFAWTSTNTGVATIDAASGLATAVAEGMTTIRASTDGVSGTASLTVELAVATVTVAPGSATIRARNSVQLVATPKDAGGSEITGRTVDWSSSDIAVVTVSPTGLATGVAQGEATITATVEGHSGDAQLTVLSVYLVNSADDVDDGACDLAHCSLREAINGANTDAYFDTIGFGIAGAGPHRIQPASALPDIGYSVLIDGYTQTGASPNTNGPGLGSNAVLMIELDGSSAGSGASGLHITAGGSTVSGLAINRFDANGILLSLNGGNMIRGIFIGTDVTGTTDLGNGGHGILIDNSAYNVIGGITPGTRNVVSGNELAGIRVDGASATENVVLGNFIGTDVTGTVDLGNTGAGVRFSGSSTNTIGGTDPAARNVISGNEISGVVIRDYSSNIRVFGNFIGTDVTGTVALGNTWDAVHVLDAMNNTIGGTAQGAGNVLSGNGDDGLQLSTNATQNVVLGNFIGTDVTGTADLGNAQNGVVIDGDGNTIGGTTPEARNVISGNNFAGVNLFGSANTVQGNFIGTNADGDAVITNNVVGLTIQQGAASNLIGGTAAGAGNLISGNGDGNEGGVTLINGVQYNVVQGNSIGTDPAGTADLGNNGPGVYIAGLAEYNIVGGTTPGTGNTIAFNSGHGVRALSGIGNGIVGNAVHSNGGLGIDLGDDGVTANDPGDPDSGPNTLQNYPVLVSATSGAGSVTIVGSLNSLADIDFRLEFFAGSACDPSGHGEGESYIGTTTVTTDGSGNADFSEVFSASIPVGYFITATATGPVGNTSEFSQCAAVN